MCSVSEFSCASSFVLSIATIISMPKDNKPHSRPTATSFFCKCSSFGCGNILNDLDSGRRKFGRYLSSINELRQHARSDKKLCRREESENDAVQDQTNFASTTPVECVTDRHSPADIHALATESASNDEREARTNNIENSLKTNLALFSLNNRISFFEHYKNVTLTFPDWPGRPHKNYDELTVDPDEKVIQEQELIYQQLKDNYQSLANRTQLIDMKSIVLLAPVYRYERTLENLQEDVKKIDTNDIWDLETQRSNLVLVIQAELSRIRRTHGDHDDTETYIDTCK